MLMRLLKNQYGVSLIEVLIGSLILGVGIAGFMKMSGLNQNQLNTIIESMEIMKHRNRIQSKLSREEICMNLIGGIGWNSLKDTESIFTQANEGANPVLEAIFPSKNKDFYLSQLTLKITSADYDTSFDMTSMSDKETYELRGDVYAQISRKSSTTKKQTFRSNKVDVIAESAPLSLMIYIGNDNSVRSCYLRNSKDIAMATYMCNEMGGVLKAGKCLFPKFVGTPSSPSSFDGVGKKINDPNMKYVSLQEMLCDVEKAVVAVEAKGVPGIIDPDTGLELPLAKGRDPIYAITKYCPIPQGAKIGGANSFFINDI